MRRSLQLALVIGVLAIPSFILAGLAGAVTTVSDIDTSSDYKTVTVTFSETVTVDGGGAIEAADVAVDGTPPSLSAIDLTGPTLTLTFSGTAPVGGVLSFPGLSADVISDIPVADGDWATIDAALRAVQLPQQEVPFAAFLTTAPDGPDAGTDPDPRFLAELLPATIATSLKLPAWLSVSRNGDGTFTVSADGTGFTPARAVETAVFATEPFNLDLRSSTTFPLSVSLLGDLNVNTSTSATTGTLTIGLQGTTSNTSLTGAVGLLQATVIADLSLNVGVDFSPDGTVTARQVTTADAAVEQVTVAGLGTGGADLVIAGTPIDTIGWPTLPTSTAGVRTETASVSDQAGGGWATAGLFNAANASVAEVLGAPGAIAAWVGDAQTQNELAVAMPTVGYTLGQSVGIAERLAVSQNLVAAAFAVTSGPFAPANATAPNLDGNICTNLTPFAVQAEKVVQATILAMQAAVAADPDRDFTQNPLTDSEVLAQISNVTIDQPTVEATFATECGYLWSGAAIDLSGSTPAVTTTVAIPAATSAPITEPISLDLSVTELNIGGLSASFPNQTISRTTAPGLNFPLGIKLVTDQSLVSHPLAVDLDGANGVTEADVTAAYRIYVPQNQQLGSSQVTVTANNLTGTAQVGFLDLDVTGSVNLDPDVSLGLKSDPTGGLGDGNVDLLEMLSASQIDFVQQTSALDTVLSVGVSGADTTNDVTAAFTFSSGVLDTTPELKFEGRLAGFVDPARSTSQSGTTSLTYSSGGDSLVISQTFGDSIELTEITPLEAVSMVADLLETLAQNASAGSADQRIPIIDVSFDEVAGFTTSLSDAADLIRDKAPQSVSELETFVNDALAANGLGAATVSFDPGSGNNPPELVIELNANYSASASYPISFQLSDADNDIFDIVPVDGGATLDASVDIVFAPKIGIVFDSTKTFSQSLFVRDVALGVTAAVSGTIEGSVAVGPVEAFLNGNADITGTFNAGLTPTAAGNDGTTISFEDIGAGNFQVDVSGSVPVSGNLTVEVPTFAGSALAEVTVAGQILPTPSTVSFNATFTGPDLKAFLAAQQPNLRTLATGVTETARFLARSSETVGALAGQVPPIGTDMEARFLEATGVLDEVADTVEQTVATIDTTSATLRTEFNQAIADKLNTVCVGPLTCSVTTTFVNADGTTDDITLATGVEVLLNVKAEVSAAAATSASLGVEPLVELNLDLTGASITTGFEASIGFGVDVQKGFFLFPGIGRDDGVNDTDGVGSLFELYAAADATLDVNLNLAGANVSANGTKLEVFGSLQNNTAAGLKVEMPTELPLKELVNRQRKLSDVFNPSLDGTVKADIPVAFAFQLGSGAAAPSLTLNVPFEFEADAATKTIKLDMVDATFESADLARMAADALTEANVYNPLNIGPIKKALDTDVPLIDKDVRTVIKELCNVAVDTGVASGPCTAYLILEGIDSATVKLNELADNGGVVKLGSFKILPSPGAGVSRYTPPAGAPTVSDDPDIDPVVADSPVATIGKDIKRFTKDYISLPILSDIPALMGIVLGGELGTDVDIVRFEIPADQPIIVGKSLSLKQELASLDIGFIEGNLTVSLNGGVGLTISGGFGYSTRGISNGNFFDGIFLIDGESTEIGIGASVSASVDGRFAVSVADLDIASVLFSGSGSFSATGGLDLFDESPVLVGRGGGDGRLFFDEIAIISEAYKNPLTGQVDAGSFLCMFQLQTSAKWSLAFSGKAKVLGITVFNESFSDSGTLWDETLSCELETRVARVEDRQLILHAGPNAGDRFDGTGDIAEDFAITVNGSDATVTYNGKSNSFPLSSFDSVLADMGLGADTLTVPATFPKPIVARGGPGGDNLQGGAADDDIDGGGGGVTGTDGADTLNGRAGNDVIRGRAGDDTIIGGAGNDDMDGGAGSDDYTFADGFGTDVVNDSGTSGIDELLLDSVTTALTGTTAFGESTIATTNGELRYPTFAIERVKGGGGDDNFAFQNQEPNGFQFDGGNGSDVVTVQTSTSTRTITIGDSGSSGSDTLNVLGTTGSDKMLLRGSSTGLNQTATNGFVARLSVNLSGAVTNTDRYDYDNSIETLNVDGGSGADEFTLDDNATSTNIIGGNGDDVIQVGQIYGQADCGGGSASATCPGNDTDSARNSAVGVSGPDAFATTVITRGHLSNGVTNPLRIEGDAGNDTITIFSNKATVEANGGADDDTFVARAFIVTASVTLNGQGGIDDFNYVVNSQIAVDGGAGVDTFTVIGTEANDGFIVDSSGGNPTLQTCPIVNGLPDPTSTNCALNSNVQNVEVFAVQGLEGDDVFWIRSSVAGSLVEMSGGPDSDTFLIGDGTLDSIDGPLGVAGDNFGSIPAIPDPVVLSGEDATPAFDPAATGGTDRGDLLQIDASNATTGLTGVFTSTSVNGLGMAPAPFTIGTGASARTVTDVLTYANLEFITATTGGGADVITIDSIHLGNDNCNTAIDLCPLLLDTGTGADNVDVKEIDGETTLRLGGGDDVVTVGRPVTGGVGDTLDDIDDGLIVEGGAGADTLDVDDTNDGATRLDIDPGQITKAGLDDNGEDGIISHTAVETVNARTGRLGDVINVRGTAADVTVGTHVYSGAGDDTVYVSSDATYSPTAGTNLLPGNVDQVQGPLFLHGEAGTNNRLLISDTSAGAGDSAVSYDGATLTGLAPAPIAHDAIGGAYGNGITVWTSELADTVAVTGSDLSSQTGIRTLTTFNTGDGGDNVTLALTAGTDGPMTVNAEEGDDTVDGSASSLDLLVFGGLGADGLTTGSGADVVFGDRGRAATADGNTVTGTGGADDTTDGGTQPIDVLSSETGGADDVINTGAGDDTAIGGVGTDTVNGGADGDVIIGGHLLAGGADTGDNLNGDDGNDVIAGDNASFERTGSQVVLTLLDIGTTAAAAPADAGGPDVVDGGNGDDRIHGQQDDDNLSGGAGADTIEGNDGQDTIGGGADQDDLTGGGSALDGVLDGTRSWVAAGVALADGNDTIDGGGDADVILGDNGYIERTANTLGGLFGNQNPAFDGVVVRTVNQSTTIDPAGSFGADLLRGGAGPDEIYGQLDTTRTTVGGNTIAGDEIYGGAGADVLIGDIGSVDTVLEDGSNATTVSNRPFLEADVRQAGTLTRLVTLFFQHDGDEVDSNDRSDATQFGAEGDDVLIGGDDDDVIHGGSGADLANGGAGNDVVFGGDGDDALWGGPGGDELFGGHDEDSLDVFPRDFSTGNLGPDPAIWFEIAPAFDALGGQDFAYGGWNSDELMADEQVNGPRPGDRLLDWTGAYNRYLGCGRGRGAGTFLRGASPANRAFVGDLAEARGAVGATNTGTSGYREIGMVESSDNSDNSGNFGGTGHVNCP